MEWFSQAFISKINSILSTDTPLTCKGCPSKGTGCAGCNNNGNQR